MTLPVSPDETGKTIALDVPIQSIGEKMSELIERLEGLTGPCRECDAMIALASGWELLKVPCQNINGSTEMGEIWLRSDYDEEWRKELISDYRSRVSANLWPESEPPAYTASKDAAMTLRPDPEAWHEIKGPRKYLNIPVSSPNYWSVSLESWNHEARAIGWGATPAIALCIAALKAMTLPDTMQDGDRYE